MTCCKYNAGMLRHKLVIQTETDTPDGAGGFVHGWTDTITLPAFIKPAGGGEYFTAQRLEAHITHKAIARWRAGLNCAMRAMFEGRPMQIRAIINVDERGRWMEIYLDEGVAT